MASRVNVRFVVLLAAFFLVASGAVVGAAYMVLTRSGDNYADLGRAAYEAGDFERASEMYGRAVGHDRTRVDWLEAWREALVQTTPETTAEYVKAYNESYLGILGQLATLQPESIDAQRELLRSLYDHTWWLLRSAEAWTSMINQATRAIERVGPDAEGVSLLRRYRGLAGIEQMSQFDPIESERERTRDDLRAAAAADPGDAAVASALAKLHMFEWRRLRRSRQLEQADEAEQQLVAQIDALNAKFPNDPLAQTAALELRLERALGAASTLPARRAALRGMRGQEDRLVAIFDAAPVEQVDGPLLSRYLRLMLMLRPDDPNTDIIRACERALTERPDDPQIHVVLIGALQRGAMHERAIAVAGTVADMPDLPLSLEGVLLKELRRRALAAQIDNSLGLWERAESESERAAIRELILARRARLVDAVPGGESAPAVLMADARLAITESRYQAALGALEQYRRSLGSESDAEVLRLTTRALLGDNQLGAAREKVEQLLALEPDNTQALLLAADIDRRLLEPRRAIDRLRLATELEPDNKAFSDALAAAEAAAGIRPTNDPVMAALIDIGERLLDETARPDAVAALEALVAQHPNDPRPLLTLIRVRVTAGDREGALALAAGAAEQFPDDTRLAAMLRMLSANDPVELALVLIEDLDADEVEKALRRRAVYLDADRPEDAEAAYAHAVAINPDHPLILELQMIEALEANRLDEAEQVAKRAAETNADEVNGQIFQALLLQGRGDDATAVETLQRVLERLPFSGRAWQMLGQSQLRLGRTTQAVESLRRSFDARPDDIRAAQALAGALLQLQRNTEALQVARRSAELNPASQPAWTLRLELEEVAGDREFVISERTRLLEANPSAFDNRIALIRVLTDAGRYADADELTRSTLDRFGDSLELAVRHAMLLSAQGSVDAGRERIERYIQEAGPESAGVIAALTLADFLSTSGRPDEAIAVLNDARSLQSAEGMEADRAIGDLLFTLGRAEESTEPYQRVIDAGGANLDTVRKRLAEAYIRVGKWDDADRVIGTFGPEHSADAETLLLRAEVAFGRGRERDAQDLLNGAVRAAPNNPLPFIRRARANMRSQDRDNEVMDDLEQALRLQPNSIVARQMRATILARRGRSAEAAAELRIAVDANPQEESLRATLIGYLVANGSWEQAISVVDEGVRVSARSPEWLRFAADTYIAAADAPENARDANRRRASGAALLREALAKNPDQETSIRLLVVLMALDPPAAREALDLLTTLDPATRESPRFLLIGARAKGALGQKAEAIADVTSAFEMLETSDHVRLWFAESRELFASPLEAARHARTLTPPEALAPAFEVQAAFLESTDVGRRSELITRLREIEPRVTDESVLVDLYRLRSALEYQAGEYPEAAKSLTAGRALRPDDSEFNNNLAFVLAKHLGDLDGAVAPAEKAAELSPNDANVLDTLGWIYLRTGRMAQAQALLQQAVVRSRRPATSVPANIHLAEVYLINEEFPAARRHLERAREFLRAAPELAPEYQGELDSLIQRVDQAEG